MEILTHLRPALGAQIARVLLFGVCAVVAAAPSASLAQDIQVGFSPDGNAEALILSTIYGAKRTVRLAAYSLTSPKVVAALVSIKRGPDHVDVQVVADEKNNTTEDRSGKAQKALGLLKAAGIPVRLNGNYWIHHDKFCVVDGVTVQTGSANYSMAAARENSENVLVLRNRPDVARAYLAHWQSRFDAGHQF